MPEIGSETLHISLFGRKKAGDDEKQFDKIAEIKVAVIQIEVSETDIEDLFKVMQKDQYRTDEFHKIQGIVSFLFFHSMLFLLS